MSAGASAPTQYGHEPSPNGPGTHRAAQLLAESVTRLLDSDAYRAALTFRRRLQKRYSFRNVWLIYTQRPDASLVAGYRAWQGVGRQVKKGERGLAIYAPLTRQEDGERVVFGFRTATVFDLSQTEGEPVLELPRPELLTGGGAAIHAHRARVEAFVRAQGVTVAYLPLARANGFYRHGTRSIVVSDALPPLQLLKTLVHEAAHALLFQDGAAYHVGELEAESCAYLVCDALALDTSRYSFPYLACWAEEPDELLAAAERACGAADAILAALAEPALELAA